MGKSITIHCLGVRADGRLVYAMNRVQIAQEEHAARRDGQPIAYWYTQTKTGERILGAGQDRAASWTADGGTVKLPKMVTCVICEGDGSNGGYHCPVCNGSGIMRPGYHLGWRPWQLAAMRQDREAAR